MGRNARYLLIVSASLFVFGCDRNETELVTFPLAVEGQKRISTASPRVIPKSVVFYPQPQRLENNFIDFVAENYARGAVPNPDHLLAIKAINSRFRGNTYNSATDNYTDNAEGFLYEQLADSLGLVDDELYLHYSDETVVQLPSGTVTVPAGGRVPIYFGSRRVCNFSTTGARLAHRIVWWRDANRYPWDGLFLDNCASVLFNFGTIVSGGTVAEAGVRIGTPAFHAWHWSWLRQCLLELSDSLAVSSSLVWPEISINVANVWRDDLVIPRPVADYLVAEFTGNPIRDFFPTIQEARRRHRLASEMGSGIILGATPTISAPDGSSVTWEEMQLGVLAYYLVVSAPRTHFALQDGTGPYRDDWDSRIMPAAMALVERRLGLPRSEPRIVRTGVDPIGNVYTVWGRDYEGGRVYVRPRGGPMQGIGSNTAVALNAPGVLVLPDGTTVTVTRLSIRNGGGAILMSPDEKSSSDSRDRIAG